MKIDRSIAQNILDDALGRKADAAEVFIRSATATTAEVKEQQVEGFDRAQDIGAGLRVLCGQRMGFAFTTDLSREALAKLAGEAVTNAQNADEDPNNGFAERPAQSYAAVNTFDPVLAGISEDGIIGHAMRMEREAFAADPRVKRIRKATARVAVSETLLMTSRGIEASYRGTSGSLSIEVVAEDQGESQAGWEADAGRFASALDAADVGRRAARRALSLLGARTIASVRAPVILDRSVAEEILSLMAAGLSAENVQKRKSLFMGKLGQDVVSPLITIHDDGLRDGGIGSAPADDEGVPASRKTVIDRGRLALFLQNTFTARKDGTVSTGNAVRGGFKGIPGVGVTNLFIVPGALSSEGLIAETGRGFYVLEIMGAHTANPVSGDFSVGATGLWIENGRVAYPVREATIAGNMLEVMKGVDAVCSDLRFSGRIASPTLRVRELSIGGK